MLSTWIFKATAQDPEIGGKPHIADLANFGQWHKDNMYDTLPESIRAYEARSDEIIMGITPHGAFPTQLYWLNHLSGKDDDAGKYILRRFDYAAEWVSEYLDQFFRKNGESSFVMSSFEQVFEYHNLVTQEIKKKLPEGDRPLVGG
ncbi:MAG: hypothetical protein ACSHW0_13800 [Thalassotalea sp.]